MQLAGLLPCLSVSSVNNLKALSFRRLPVCCIGWGLINWRRSGSKRSQTNANTFPVFAWRGWIIPQKWRGYLISYLRFKPGTSRVKSQGGLWWNNNIANHQIMNFWNSWNTLPLYMEHEGTGLWCRKYRYAQFENTSLMERGGGVLLMHALPLQVEQAISSLRSGKSNNEHFSSPEELLNLKWQQVPSLSIFIGSPLFLQTADLCIVVNRTKLKLLTSFQTKLELLQATDRNIFLLRFVRNVIFSRYFAGNSPV
jgi:hypothetical protein